MNKLEIRYPNLVRMKEGGGKIAAHRRRKLSHDHDSLKRCDRGCSEFSARTAAMRRCSASARNSARRERQIGPPPGQTRTFCRALHDDMNQQHLTARINGHGCLLAAARFHAAAARSASDLIRRPIVLAPRGGPPRGNAASHARRRQSSSGGRAVMSSPLDSSSRRLVIIVAIVFASSRNAARPLRRRDRAPEERSRSPLGI